MKSGFKYRTTAAWFGVARPDLGWVPPLRYLARRRELLRIAALWPRGASVLEVGCGAGAFLHDLTRMGFDVTGVESSDDARALAVAMRDAESLGWEIHRDTSGIRTSFEVIGAFDVVEHIEDDVAALRQWRELTVPGGILCISVPAHRDWWSAGDVWAGHFRRYDRSDVHRLLAASGWKVERTIAYGFPSASVSEWLGRPYYARALARRGLVQRHAATAKSGIDRRPYLSLWPILGSALGGLLIRGLLAAQSFRWPERMASGYIVVARAGE